MKVKVKAEYNDKELKRLTILNEELEVTEERAKILIDARVAEIIEKIETATVKDTKIETAINPKKKK